MTALTSQPFSKALKYSRPFASEMSQTWPQDDRVDFLTIFFEMPTSQRAENQDHRPAAFCYISMYMLEGDYTPHLHKQRDSESVNKQAVRTISLANSAKSEFLRSYRHNSFGAPDDDRHYSYAGSRVLSFNRVDARHLNRTSLNNMFSFFHLRLHATQSLRLLPTFLHL